MTATDLARAGVLPVGARPAVIAGSGYLPVNVAESLAAAGFPPFVILIDGEADSLARLSVFRSETFQIHDYARLASLLRRHGITHVVLAGGVARRPPWHSFLRTPRLLLILRKVVTALARGDNALLSAIIADLESQGVTVIGAHDVVPDLITRTGVLTLAKPSAADRRDLGAALEAALAIGALDIGQAAVSIGGRAVALEGIEGTDGLLERVRALRSHGRLAGQTGGVLVKAAKPGQELRADLPTIGPETVTAAHAAGLAGIGLEAERSLLIDADETVRRADALGLFIVGLAPSQARVP